MPEDAIRQRLDELAATLADVRQEQAIQAQAMAQQGHDLRYMRGLLAGDALGQGGLLSRMKAQEDWRQRVNKTLGAVWALLAAGIAAGFAWLLGLIR